VEEEDDGGTVVQGTWVRKQGYMSEFEIDARWILYFPNDSRPQGSLRIVSHPDLPPGHLKSFVSIVTKRLPKTRDELAKTLENYGLLNETNLFYHQGIFYKEQDVENYFLHKGQLYLNRNYYVRNNQPTIEYSNPVMKKITIDERIQKTRVYADEYNIITYKNQITEEELQGMIKTVFSELEAYNINEHIQTWDTEQMDKKRNLEEMFKVKIFQ
jgi:hypothetical protein